VIRHLFLLVLTYAALILDASSSNWSLPQGTAPQFLFMTAGIALLLCEGSATIFWAALIGGLSDALARGPLGLNIVLLANLAFFAQIFGTHSLRNSAFGGGGMIWAFVTLALFGSLSLRSLLHGDPINAAYLGQYAAGRAGGSVALFLVVMFSWKLLSRSLRFVLPSVQAGSERQGWTT
jgi:cell shape-determining protein MreD